MMHAYRAFAAAIAQEAGELLRQRFRSRHRVEYKGEIDLVTEADRLAEDLLVRRIRARYPDHDILAEESAPLHTGASCRWIIDPLDGTTNYAHGFPMFCVSVALEVEGAIRVGAVYQPLLEEMFWAAEGEGAFLNGEPIRVSGMQDLSRSLLATGFPYDIRRNPNNNINYFNALAKTAQAVRRAGSAALDMAYVAAGRFDGFWELKLRPWDTAAGWLLVCEAGGTVTDLFGQSFDLDAPHVIASNGRIHPALVAILAATEPLEPEKPV